MRDTMTYDLSQYTPHYLAVMSELISHTFSPADIIRIDRPALTVEYVYNNETVIEPLAVELFMGLVGYLVLPTLVRSALPHLTQEFAEAVATRYGLAYGTGELEFKDSISLAEIESQLEHVPFKAVVANFITRWRAEDVALQTDVVETQYLWPDNNYTVRRLPVAFPILIVGKYLLFNQALPMQYRVSYPEIDGEDQPIVAGALIYRSTGLATVVSEGAVANVYTATDSYVVDAGGRVQ